MTRIKPNKLALWAALSSYAFEDLIPTESREHVVQKFGHQKPGTDAFASKISKKHAWNETFALRAIEEYKRFVYLGIISAEPVTPSKILDIVWHEHILFTQAYRQFCEHVIHYQFDHNPELVPADEQTIVFRQQFEDTLALYLQEFGCEAPEDIWGTPKFKREEKEARSTTTESRLADGQNDSNFLPLFMLLNSGAMDPAPRQDDPLDSGHSAEAGHGTHAETGTSSDTGSAPDSGGGDSNGSCSSGDSSCGGGGCSSGCGGGGCGGGGD